MSPDFNTADVATWPLTLTAEHLAAIYHRSVGAVKKACQLHRFVPAPYRTRPLRWRKTDVVRDVDGARASTLLRRVS